MFYDQTGSGKSNMAACKHEVHVSQLVDVIESDRYVYFLFKNQMTTNLLHTPPEFQDCN